jgi:two-component system phosphate regulon sensor histidine kinase PhoR
MREAGAWTFISGTCEKNSSMEIPISRQSAGWGCGPVPRMAEEQSCEALRRQLEEMTLRNNERNNYINSIFSAMEDGFVLTDPAGTVVFFNKSAEVLLGIDASFLFEGTRRGNPVMETILAKGKEAQAKGEAKSFELKNHEGLDLQVRLSRVTSKYGEKEPIGVLAIVKDITERKKVETIRKEFVANVSHEFRTPLTLISGFIEMLKMYGDLPEEDRKRSLEILEIETGRLKKLISELLLLSKMENRVGIEGETDVDLAKVLGQVETVMSPLAEKKGQKISLRLGSIGQASRLKGDENWLFHAFRNLLDNAIKYSGEGTEIEISASESGDEAKIEFKDQGPGIAPENLERIFERFYRVDGSRSSKTGGSGLGLAIVKDIVSIYRGRVEVESAVGRGSTFRILLPLDNHVKNS